MTKTKTETIRTARHQYVISPAFYDESAFMIRYRAINQRTGKPWQASRYVDELADINPGRRYPRAVAYSTMELAKRAVAAHAERNK